MRTCSFMLSVLASMAVLQAEAAGPNRPEEKADRSFTVHPIGHVQKADGRTLIVLEKKLISAARI